MVEACNPFIAHIRITDNAIQTVFEHNDQVAAIASSLGMPYKIGNLSQFAGRHHDDGKNTYAYFNYIRAAAAGENVVRGSVTHSTHGAVLANNLTCSNNLHSKLTSEMIRTAIKSHHGLRDCITTDGEITFSESEARIVDSYNIVERIVTDHYGKKSIDDEFLEACFDVKNIHERIKDFCQCWGNLQGSQHFYLAMYERLLISILVDADRSDTSCFMDRVELSSTPNFEQRKAMWEVYLQHCESSIQELQTRKEPSTLDSYRVEISKMCAEFDRGESGIFRLVVPCGAGKTLSSLRYALHTAQRYGKNRIFYIAPFNSILEQNANEIAQYVGDTDAVLEHHSNIVFDSENDEEEKKYKLLTENWAQSPIVATTAVQFLNTLFTGNTSNVRRMQALGNSVIIIDEVQALPVKAMKLFNAAMNFLVYFCKTSVVLCSATQPLLDKLNNYQIIAPVSIIDNEEKYTAAFKRVEIIDATSGSSLSFEEAADFILSQANDVNSILAIVNIKLAARTIWKRLHDTVVNNNSLRLFHLSTNMCPAHRSHVLTEIRECLKNKDFKQKVICISTTLIEAGVDISFERVIRSLTGLDSIVQAAGRCNRNRETNCGIVSVIYIRDENVSHLGYIQNAQDVTREIFYNIHTHPERYFGGILSKSAMDEFYAKHYRPLLREMEYPLKSDPEHTIIDLLTTNPSGSKRARNSHVILLKQAFREAGNAFQVIEDIGKRDVIVEYDDDALQHLAKLEETHLLSEKRKELRYLQKYTVQLSENEMDKISECVRFEESTGAYVLSKLCYHDDFGVSDEQKTLIVEGGGRRNG